MAIPASSRAKIEIKRIYLDIYSNQTPIFIHYHNMQLHLSVEILQMFNYCVPMEVILLWEKGYWLKEK